MEINRIAYSGVTLVQENAGRHNAFILMLHFLSMAVWIRRAVLFNQPRAVLLFSLGEYILGGQDAIWLSLPAIFTEDFKHFPQFYQANHDRN